MFSFARSANKQTSWDVEAANVPRTVQAHLDYHRRMSSYNQRIARAAESLILLASASIPVAATLDAPAAALGVLGGLVTVLTGMMTQYRWRENWARHSGVVINIQHELVLFDHGCYPYQGSEKARPAKLAIRIEDLVRGDAAVWADREHRAREDEGRQRQGQGSRE
jgi:Protein of unknown function (DUF4231)